MTDETDLLPFRDAIVQAIPHLAGACFTFLPPGWHSIAVDADDALVFKFPRGEAARTALEREASLLTVIGPAVTMPVPALTLFPGPPVFSMHRKLRGAQLAAADYQRLAASAREHLAASLALFYAELHALDSARLRAAGADDIEPWMPAEEMLRRAMPVLPATLWPTAEDIAGAWDDLSPDPHGTTYGFFDGHGWNMAFDHEGRRLNGIYDFADSGFGPLHQDFIYSNFISPDLTARIVEAYEALTSRALDRRRIDILTGAHRLWEVAQTAADPAHAPGMAKSFAEWVEQQSGRAR